ATPAAAAPQAQPPQAAPVAQAAPTASADGLLPTRVPGRAGAALGFGMASKPGAGSDNGNGKAASTFGGNGFAAAAATNGGGDTNGTSTWQSPADEGWQRAEALLAPVSEKTTAGLPKRVPKAHLVPGSAAPRGDSSASQGSGGGTTAATLAPPALPPRTADAVRGRMSSFQQGIRRGRHTMIEAYSGEASHPSAHRADEEQE
ncbi:MAG TPA: hypothetical protein VFX16_09410, partial [Pseudonocardiaceae bacterium]|nr:hypothetical protein [Pseudonocardiaceae bacterium]